MSWKRDVLRRNEWTNLVQLIVRLVHFIKRFHLLFRLRTHKLSNQREVLTAATKTFRECLRRFFV